MNSHPATISTQQWLKSFVIEFNICPFAHRVEQENSIRYVVIPDTDLEKCLITVITECVYLDSTEETETTLLIFLNTLSEFDEYLDFLEIAQQLLADQGYEGLYQLASFHPHYCFADSDESDAANYTNRSPYPMLHIIRETSLESALQQYPNPEKIPQRNMLLTRQMGLKKLQSILAACPVG